MSDALIFGIIVILILAFPFIFVGINILQKERNKNEKTFITKFRSVQLTQKGQHQEDHKNNDDQADNKENKQHVDKAIKAIIKPKMDIENGIWRGIGNSTKSEFVSAITSRLGKRSLTEPLNARLKFMEGVIPKCKRSRYMVPIQE